MLNYVMVIKQIKQTINVTITVQKDGRFNLREIFISLVIFTKLYIILNKHLNLIMIFLFNFKVNLRF